MEGVFLRNLFTLRARTRKPLYLFLMFVFGVVPFTISVTLLVASLPQLDLFLFIYLSVAIIVSGAVTINFILSILVILKVIPPQKHSSNIRAKAEKKKFPKRRKDFK